MLSLSEETTEPCIKSAFHISRQIEARVRSKLWKVGVESTTAAAYLTGSMLEGRSHWEVKHLFYATTIP